MIKKSIYCFLIFLIVHVSVFADAANAYRQHQQIDDLQARYPGAVILRMTPEEYAAFKKQLGPNVQIREISAAPNGSNQLAENGVFSSYAALDGSSSDGSSSGGSSGSFLGDVVELLVEVFRAGPHGIIVLLILIAVVFVGFIAISVFGSILNFYLNDEILSGYWKEVGLSGFSVISGREVGSAGGLETGIGRYYNSLGLGLILEGGYLDATFYLEDGKTKQNVFGPYFLLGATARWRLTDSVHPHFIDVKVFAGGFTEHGRTRPISVTKIGMNLALSDHHRLGASLGFVYLDPYNQEGLVRDQNNYNLIGGIEAAYTF